MTRYPQSGKGHRWTAAELKALSPASAGDTVRDGDGLVGAVRRAGAGPVAVGEWTPHDLPHTSAPMMQALGISPDVIDRCQSSTTSDSTRY